MGAMAIFGIMVTAFTRTLTMKEVIIEFSNNVKWLIILAFFIFRGFIKTGLGTRIAYIFIRLLGKKTIGLGYRLIASDLVLAPVIPSNTSEAERIVPILHFDKCSKSRVFSFRFFLLDFPRFLIFFFGFFLKFISFIIDFVSF